ncbi:MAG: 50S ribosomal protein L23 [Anaerolineae bacterium]|nr:50S ribosomal protein L23 [Anaerolineae bacterium]
MHLYEVIKHPVITEKTRYQALQLGQYTFMVDRSANKAMIKQAVEEIYDVEVVTVNTMLMPAKTAKRWGRRHVVRQPVWKKAVVKLAEGDTIPVFEGG